MIGSVLVTLTDGELLDLVRRGDESAFTELYARHRDVAQRMAATYCRPGEADDLVDVAFEKVLGALRRGHGPTGAFRAYLFVTLRRLAAEQAQRPREWPYDELPEPLAAASAMPSLDTAERDMITGAFDALPGRWQAVLWHTAVEGRHPRELASLLGMSANAVSALAYRARERLRQAYLQAHLQAAPHSECEPHRSSLGAYVRDGQSPRERRATSEHLERCRSCQALVAELHDINRSLARAVLPLFVATSAGKLGAALTGSTMVSEVGGAARRSLATWAKLYPVRGLVGGIAASSALVLGITQLQPHIRDRGPLPPAVGTTLDGGGGAEDPATEALAAGDAAPVANMTPCPLAPTDRSAASGAAATTAPGLLPSVLAPLLEALSPTTTVPPPPAATLTEVVCTPTGGGHSELTVVVSGTDDSSVPTQEGQGSEDGLAGSVPVEAEVTIDLSEGARVAVNAGIPDGCDVTGDLRSLICSLDALLPGAPTEATVGLEVDLPQAGAPSATVTLSDGDQQLSSRILDLSPVTDLLGLP